MLNRLICVFCLQLNPQLLTNYFTVRGSLAPGKINELLICNDGSVISSEYSAMADHKMKVNKLLLYAIKVFGIISIFVIA